MDFWIELLKIGGGSAFVGGLLIGLVWLCCLVKDRCKHEWELTKEITVKDSCTIESIIYIHGCKKCKKIKRQKVEAC